MAPIAAQEWFNHSFIDERASRAPTVRSIGWLQRELQLQSNNAFTRRK